MFIKILTLILLSYFVVSENDNVIHQETLLDSRVVDFKWC